MSWLLWLAIAVGTTVVLLFGLVFVSRALANKRRREALAARGSAIGTWTVYYDVKGRRIGLRSSFGATALLRYLLFRAHDLFEYKRGLEAERQGLASVLRAAARGQCDWQFLFPPPTGDCFHAGESPNATLFKFFEGTLYEHAIDQPRFVGGDSLAKQEGLVGECVALVGHLRSDPAWRGMVESAIDDLVERELGGGNPPSGAKFWRRPNDVLAILGNSSRILPSDVA